MSNKVKIRILAVFSIIVLCIGLTVRYLQNDTFYLIKLGEDIVHNGIDFMDHYCWISKLPYTYPHWLFDVLMYFVYSIGGYAGIYVSTIIMFILLAISIYVVNLKINKNEWIAFFVAIIGILSLVDFATARSQLLTYTLFLLEVYFINKLVNTGKKRYVVFLSLISLLVANVHATIWVFYFVLFLPFIGEFVIYKLINCNFIKNKFNIKEYKFNKVIIENVPNMKLLLISICIGLLMGLLSPSKICYTYVFKTMMGDSQQYISEHLPTAVASAPYFAIVTLLGVITLIIPKSKIKLNELFMLFGLLVMAFSARRHVALFCIIGLLYISIILVRLFKGKFEYRFNITLSYFAKNKILYCILFILIGAYSISKFNVNSKNEFVSMKDYPVETSEYIKENFDLKNLKLYNEYNVGSYLLLNDIKVFIDSRCDLYLKEFNNKNLDIFDDTNGIEYNYENIFKKYAVEYALINQNSTMYIILDKDPNYKLIYKDTGFGLFENLTKY